VYEGHWCGSDGIYFFLNGLVKVDDDDESVGVFSY
jgi:hypothetical protein